MKLTVF